MAPPYVARREVEARRRWMRLDAELAESQQERTALQVRRAQLRMRDTLERDNFGLSEGCCRHPGAL